MKQNIGLPFSALLNSLMGKYYHAVRDLSVQTEKLGQKISPRSIQRYLNSQRIPRFSTAKLLIEAAGGSVSQEDLEECLRLERELQQGEFEDIEIMNIKISNQLLSEKLGQNRFEILDVVRQRAELLYPEDSNAMSEYICDLIAKDMRSDVI